LSSYKNWQMKDHAIEWLLFPENISPRLCIDETSMTNGDLYTILSNPNNKGKQGTLVAIIAGVQSDKIIQVLMKMPESLRQQVKEITLDMANSMNKIARVCFPKACRVIDRFHLQKLANEAVQEVRVKHRWEAIEEENQAIKQAKWEGKTYKPLTFSNGDTKKQLLARGRYLLFKSADKWSDKQKERAKILFAQYPSLKEAYSLSQGLRSIFNRKTIKDAARLSLAKWYNRVEQTAFQSFKSIAGTIYSHYDEILNFFNNRSTNAFAESFNAKLKAFRTQLRGVTDISFFLFRVTKLFA